MEVRHRSSNSRSHHNLKLVQMESEIQSLNDYVSILQLQLNRREIEMNQYKEQLSCLKLLVKRAWRGDHEAIFHVAKIVGVAAPEIRDTSEGYAYFVQSRAINNWASLYSTLVRQLKAQFDDVMILKKQEYFMEREALIDSYLAEQNNEYKRNASYDPDVLLFVQSSANAGKNREIKTEDKPVEISAKKIVKGLTIQQKENERLQEDLENPLYIQPIKTAYSRDVVATSNDQLYYNHDRDLNEISHKSVSTQVNLKDTNSNNSSDNQTRLHMKRQKSVSYVASTSAPKATTCRRRPTTAYSHRTNNVSSGTLAELRSVEQQLRKTASELQRKLSIK